MKRRMMMTTMKCITLIPKKVALNLRAKNLHQRIQNWMCLEI